MSGTKKLLRQLVREIAAKDVSVDGFSFNDELEKRVWDSENAMHDDVREALLAVADDFIEGLSIDVQPEDIRLTGSLANYNWSKYSDVDLHVIINFSDVDEDQDLVEGYFNSASALWNLRHDIKAKGYDVEIYVENVGEEHISTGLYSVLNGEWIRVPPDEQGEKISFDAVKKKAAGIMRQIAELEKMDSSPEEIIKLAEKVKEKIRRMRRSGLRTRKGQYSTGNIAFKVLRRNGSLEKLSNIKNDAYDTSMSIKETRIIQIIREELLREDDIYMAVGDISRGKDPDHFMYASSDPIEAAHALLGLASVADPTMLTDLTDAALYSLQGKHREAALVIAFSAAGIGAGALTVKAMRAKKAARQSKMEQAAKDIRAQGSANSKKVAGSIEQGLKDADTYIDDVAAGRRVKFPDRPASPGKGHGGGKPLKPGTVRTGTGEVVDAKPGAPRGEGPKRGSVDPRAADHILKSTPVGGKINFRFWGDASNPVQSGIVADRGNEIVRIAKDAYHKSRNAPGSKDVVVGGNVYKALVDGDKVAADKIGGAFVRDEPLRTWKEVEGHSKFKQTMPEPQITIYYMSDGDISNMTTFPQSEFKKWIAVD
jgi:hypothetical protein